MTQTERSLGAFSMSLNVTDLATSWAFYETLGFEILIDHRSENWMILRNDTLVLGLFQGMFDAPMLTFNPGWRGAGEPLDRFEDVRDIAARMQRAGYKVEGLEQPEGTGPAHVTLRDPDGHIVFLDQHVPRPGG